MLKSMPNMERFSMRYKQEIRKRRQRDTQVLRLRHNIRCHPWSVVLLVLFFLALAKISFSFPGSCDCPLLETVWNHGAKLVMLLFSILIFFAVLTAPPRGAKEWELTLTQLRIVDYCGFGPILIAKQRLANSGNQRYIFYSRGISETLWEEHKQEIPKDMGVTLEIEKNFKHTLKYCLFAIVSHDSVNHQGEQLTDDEL